MTRSRVLETFAIARVSLAIWLSVELLISPLWAVPSAALGTVVFADRARVGGAETSAGSTVFSGDRLSTDNAGTVQVRVRAARLLLASSSSATLAEEQAGPSATLTAGTATFSTANSKAFALHVATAVLRPNTDQPTVGKVIVLGPKELMVKSIRGSLEIAVEDDVREIPEGAAYRVVLDPNPPEPQGPRGAGTTKGTGGPPIKGAKSKFLWYVIAITGGVTTWVALESMESEDGKGH
ncbi:MAG: hypothetical protein HRJ53_27555 [Acidobacteria bacterium Pan2503]|uniref:FecR protein domain-containing protein n=1 Tax=Candidatus Acidiferrum panamense TaxID=2741543 RepID=A0A7V8NWG2_9BACT|nr:hypothetical protein [Candidatus Acidoferrum panamensis]